MIFISFLFSLVYWDILHIYFIVVLLFAFEGVGEWVGIAEQSTLA